MAVRMEAHSVFDDLGASDLELLLARGTGPLFVIDDEGLVVFANEAAAGICERSRDDLPGTSLADLFEGLDGESLQETSRAAESVAEQSAQVAVGRRPVTLRLERVGGRTIASVSRAASSDPVLSGAGREGGRSVEGFDLGGGGQTGSDSELLSRLVDTIPVMIVVWDPHVRVLRFNREIERVLGWTNEDALRDDIMARIYPDPEYRERVVRFMASLETGWRDFEMTAKNGESVLCSWANIRLSDDRRVGIGIDLTARKEAEQTIREREAELRLLMDAVPVLISRVDADERYQVVNARYEEWFGRPREAFVGRTMGDVVGDRIYDEIGGHVKKALSGETVRFEMTLPTPGGGRRDVEAQYVPHVDADGNVAGFYVVVADITDRKAAQEELATAYHLLEKEHKRLKTVLDVMPIAVVIADAEGHVLEMNDAARRLWDGDVAALRVHGLEGRAARFAGTDRRLGADDWALARALRGEPVLEGQEIEIETPDGSRRTVLDFALPIGADGGIDGAVAVSVDVTRLRAAEDALRELNATLERRVSERTADLEERNRELQHFAYIASHDLREPLRKIRAFGDLLKEDAISDADQDAKFYVGRIQAAAERMDDLLNDLLAFSRISTHVRPFEPVRLRDVVYEVWSELEPPGDDFEVEIDVEANVVLDADASQIRQLVDRLVANALKYRREDVPLHVRVSASTVADGKESSEPHVRIVVEDNGIGFDMKFAERIFEPFERLHGFGEYEGTGMGLAICRRIVHRHRGLILADGRPGEGSTFVCLLPLRQYGDGTGGADATTG